MRVFICTMDDPVYTLPFIREIIEKRKGDIVGVAVSEGNRLTIGKNRSKVVYLFSLFLIMGPRHFIKNVLTMLHFKLRRLLARRTGWIESPSILAFAGARGIPVFEVASVNDPAFLEEVRKLKPDVIINQAQDILREDFLGIPRIGVLNRHNALLPKNRGRLTPFWVAYRNEPETGVSIHFVTPEIDAGDIVVQERFSVADDDFNTIVRKNYDVAANAMLKALDRLNQGNCELLPNDDTEATYNTVPTLKEAVRYRLNRIKVAFQ